MRRFAWLCILLAPACSDATEDMDTAAELFAPGPHAVGFLETTLTYDPVGDETERTLAMNVWYPATAGGQEDAVYRVAGIVELPPTGALREPAAATGAPFPLAVYSHGFGGQGLLAYPYAELFASHGWVVVAPDHTGNATVDYLGDTDDPVARINVNRPSDITAVIDWAGTELEIVSAATDEVFVFGHSYGAFTSMAAAGIDLDVERLEGQCMDADCDVYAEPEVRAALADFGDDRVVAIAAQAPSIVEAYVDGGLAALDVPVLMQSARRDITTPHDEQTVPTWSGLDHPDDVWVELPEGGHLSFISICDDLEQGLLDLVQPDNAEDGCGDGFTPVGTTLPVMGAYILGFARLHMLGEERFRAVVTGDALDASVRVELHP